MKTKQLALDALKKCLDEFGPEHDGTDFESECTECWTAKQAREAIAALEVDIAQAVEPALVQMRTKGGTWREPDGGKTKEKALSLMRDNPGVYEMRELFTTPPEPAVNAELLEALKEIAGGTYDTWSEGYRAQQIAVAAIAKATS